LGVQKLTVRDYNRWRRTNSEAPSVSTITGRLGWRNACVSASLAPTKPAKERFNDTDITEAVAKAAAAMGVDLVTRKQYDAWQQSHGHGSPTGTVVQRRFHWRTGSIIGPGG